MPMTRYLALLPLLLAAVAADPKVEELGPGQSGSVDVAASGAGTIRVDGEVPTQPYRTPEAALLPGLRPPAVPRSYRLVPAPGEFRGAWLHWQDYASPEAISRTIARAQRARLNALLALANYPHQAMWRSRVLPLNPHVAPDFDPLRELARQAHAAGIQVHPYLVTLNGGLTKHPVFEEDWYARDAAGQKVGGWLNPSHPDVIAFLSTIVQEIAATGVDGIHYDYIRHEYDTDYGYSDFTRAKFHETYGWDPLVLKGSGGGTGMRLLQTSYHKGDGAGLLKQSQEFLANAGYQPPLVPEQNLPQLRADTILIAGNLYSGKVTGETVDHLIDFTARGGVTVIFDGPEITTISQRFAAALGLGGKGYFDSRPVTITVLHGPDDVTAGVERVIRTTARGNPSPTLTDAQLLALFDDGTPAVTYKPYGQGAFLVFNYHCYQDGAAENPELLKLFGNLVEWLSETHGIANTTKLIDGATRPSKLTWDKWRIEEVSRLVHTLTTAAREAKPDIITSAAGGTQREDLRRVKRDGLAWLRRNDVQFLCPMAYTTNNDILSRRLDSELAPVDEPELRQMLFAGIGIYKAPDLPQRWVEQIAIARRKGFRGVCLFDFDNLNDGIVTALANGPFQEAAPVPWRQVLVGQ